jgi:hypothetical protein
VVESVDQDPRRMIERGPALIFAGISLEVCAAFPAMTAV